MAQSLELLLKSPSAYPLAEGISTVIADPNNRTLYKVIKDNKQNIAVQALLQFKQRASITLREKIHLYSHINHRVPASPDFELQTVEGWHAARIPTANAIERQPNAIVYEFIPAESCGALFRSETVQEKVFLALMRTFHQMRHAAKRTQNPYLLHTDAHPSNFLYQQGMHAAIAIDPSPRPLNAAKSFDEIDSLLNLQLMYTLLDVSEKSGHIYAVAFADTLTRKERAAALQENIPVPESLLAIHQAYRIFAHAIGYPKAPRFSEAYSSERTRTVDKILRGTASGN